MTELAETGAPSRRDFIRNVSGGGVTLLGATAATTLLTGCPEDAPNSWLDGHRRLTLEAVADTILPNENGDGGREARALEVMFDPYYASNGWLDDAISQLDSDCQSYYGKNFRDCTAAQRTESLQYLSSRQNTAPWYTGESQKFRTIHQGLILLTKLAWFGGLASSVGTQYLGYPGRSNGYAAPGGPTPPTPSPPVGTASGNHYQVTPLQIRDNQIVNSDLVVSGTGTVREVFVTVVIQHTYKGDLRVKLRSPAGTWVTLHDRTGGSADDLFFVNHRLTAYAGQAAAGTWRLEVGDHASNDTGWIHQFGLHLTAR